jgi:hypothetical protein
MGRFERRTDEDGNEVVVNPPVIAEYEEKLAAAQANADELQIARVSKQYAQAREQEIRDIEEWEQKQESREDDADREQPKSVDSPDAPGADGQVPPPPSASEQVSG